MAVASGVPDRPRPPSAPWYKIPYSPSGLKRALTIGSGSCYRSPMKSTVASEQVVLTGVLTEADVFRACMRRMGSLGGKKTTPAQTEARRVSIRKATEARMKKREQQNR